MNITKPVKANERNRDFLMRLVQNGPDEYPGAKILEKKWRKTLHLDMLIAIHSSYGW